MKRTQLGLVPLEKRMNAHQQEKRQQKIAARATVARTLGRDIAIVTGYTKAFINLTLWQRLQWIALGPNAIGTTKASTILIVIFAVVAIFAGYVLFK